MASDVTLPRPNETTFALCLLMDSKPAASREYALADVVESLKTKWTPGYDLCIVIRQPTPSELLRMQVALAESENVSRETGASDGNEK